MTSLTPSGRERIRQSRLGKHWSEEIKQKISNSRKGKDIGHPHYGGGTIVHKLDQFCQKCNGVHPSPPLTKDQLAYIGGILDAEGTVWNGYGRHSKTRCLRIAIYNTHKPVLEQVRLWTTFGVVAQRVNYPSHFGSKPMFQWTCQTTELSKYLLGLLLPYLRVKRKQVEDALGIKVEDALMGWPYVSAFFDGEGCVTAYLERRSQHRRCHLAMSQKDRAVLDEIQAFLGSGKVWATKDGQHILAIHDHETQRKFIDSVLPFSIIKYPKLQGAKLLLEFTKRSVKVKSQHAKKEQILEPKPTLEPPKEPIPTKPIIVKTPKVLLRIEALPKEMSWEYIARLFDRSGYVVNYQNKGYTNHTHYDLTVGQKNRSVLGEIQKFLGYGHVYANGDGNFKLKITDHECQSKFIEGVLPFSIVKRVKLEEAKTFIGGKNWNIDKPLRSRHVTSGEIALKYAQGVSTHALAREYGVSQPAIHARLKRFGTPMRPLGTNQYSSKGAHL